MTTLAGRFKPSRAGIINLWDYIDEEFVFADGRLALRGHNGSGKTKALEVLFPFVLDGNLDARRLDPFSGENRTMKSNLLYRGQESAYGYVWMEFARQSEAGETETVTLIVGLRVHRNWNRPKPSFFVTDLRLGRDFGLLGPESRPLTANQLREVLGRSSHRDNKTDYQDLVDARLFDLGPNRYKQLLDLLIALRKPMLAKDLDPATVSATLTAGLSPVDEDLIEQAARDFENLAAVQAEYDRLTTADAAVRAFLRPYSAYLRGHTRHQLGLVDARLTAAAGYADTVASASHQARTAGNAHRAAVGELEKLTSSIGSLRARRQGLTDDPAYKEHERLVREAEQLTQRQERLEQDGRRLEKDRGNVGDLLGEAGKNEDRLARIARDNARHADDLADAARRAALTRDGFGPADTGDDLVQTAKARVVAREEEIAAVRTHLKQVEDAVRVRDGAARVLGDARSEFDRRTAALTEAGAVVERTRTEVAAELTAWAGRWRGGGPFAAVTDADVDVLADALDRIGELGASGLADAYATATEQRRTAAVEERTRLSAGEAEIVREIAAREEERASIAAERDDAPPVSDLRPADRDGRPGAPLWRLVRFADHVDDAEAAAIEGALYGAGLLTAWVHPDPALTTGAVAAAEADGFLVARAGDPRPTGRTLADVLLPEEQEAVEPAVIAAVLASVAVTDDLTGDAAEIARAGHMPAMVSGNAQFALGPQVGARPKPRAEYIGATNRAARRRRRLEELADLLARLGERRDGTRQAVERCAEAVEDFARARKALVPAAKPIVDALAAAARAAALLAGADERLRRATTELDAATAELDARSRRLRQAAAERHLPSDADGITAVERALKEFETAAGHLVRGRGDAVELAATLDDQRARIERLDEENRRAADQLAADNAEYEALSQAHRARVESVDSDYVEVAAALNRIDAELRELGRRTDPCRKSVDAHHDAEVLATAAASHARTSLAEAMRELLTQLQAFGAGADPDLRPLLDIADPGPWPTSWPDAASAAAEFADRLSAPDWSGAGAEAVKAMLPPGAEPLLDAYAAATRTGRPTPEGAVRSAAEEVWRAFRDLETALRTGEHGYQVEISGQAPLVVEVDSTDGRLPLALFARTIADDVADQQTLLEERERSVLEDSLLTALAQQIHTRVVAARDLVQRMDEDTRSKPMSSGTAVGIGWVRADKLTDHQAAAAALLERDATALGSDGLAELRALVRTMIHVYRANHPRDTYREALGVVLDYRAWHAFELRLYRRGETRYEKLTRKKHSEMSGGEKSASIHMPLFAAANALYLSARSTCPRLVALDEAFAGIDGRFTPELLGLTVQFDLDLFMTGYDLWVAHGNVPMAAHYDMHHHAATHTVSSLLVLWDGKQLIDAAAGFAGNEELAAALLGFTPSRRTPAGMGVAGGTELAFVGGSEDDEAEDDEP